MSFDAFEYAIATSQFDPEDEEEYDFCHLCQRVLSSRAEVQARTCVRCYRSGRPLAVQSGSWCCGGPGEEWQESTEAAGSADQYHQAVLCPRRYDSSSDEEGCKSVDKGKGKGKEKGKSQRQDQCQQASGTGSLVAGLLRRLKCDRRASE